MITQPKFYGYITNDGSIDCTPGRVEFIAERDAREAALWARSVTANAARRAHAAPRPGMYSANGGNADRGRTLLKTLEVITGADLEPLW